MRQGPNVYLVGAGPGDPDLLTVKAVRLLREADVVVYDRLVGQGILDLVPRGIPLIHVGKASGHHTLPQAEITELIVRLVRAGHKVVRLKGGDPFIFGRGGEEAEDLDHLGIPYEVVPGVTAASGCAAAIGMPLTQRGLATGVRFVTGHRQDDGPLDLNWASLADIDTTLAIYMGQATVATIGRRLIEAGLPPDLPAVAVSRATLPGQSVCPATLATLAERVTEAGLTAPVLLIVGRVAGKVAAQEMIRNGHADSDRPGRP